MIWQIKKIGSHCTHIFSCRKILFYEEKEKKRTDEIQEVNRLLIRQVFLTRFQNVVSSRSICDTFM